MDLNGMYMDVLVAGCKSKELPRHHLEMCPRSPGEEQQWRPWASSAKLTLKKLHTSLEFLGRILRGQGCVECKSLETTCFDMLSSLIHRGCWHGDVMAYQRDPSAQFRYQTPRTPHGHSPGSLGNAMFVRSRRSRCFTTLPLRCSVDIESLDPEHTYRLRVVSLDQHTFFEVVGLKYFSQSWR